MVIPKEDASNWLKMGVSAKKTVMVINILQMICIGHVTKAPEP